MKLDPAGSLQTDKLARLRLGRDRSSTSCTSPTSRLAVERDGSLSRVVGSDFRSLMRRWSPRRTMTLCTTTTTRASSMAVPFDLER